MRVLFLGAGFEPEITALAPYNTDLCKYLVARGHEVAAIVGFPNYPQWRKYDEYRGQLVAREVHDGVRVLRVPQYIPAKPTPAHRIAYDTTFSVSALVAGLAVRRPDIILATCSPLQLGVTAALLSGRWRCPFIFHIQDLLPEGAIALGMLTNRRAIAVANLMANFVYERASMVTGIGLGFLEALRRRGVAEAKLAYLPNWVDLDKIAPSDRMSDWRRRQGIGPEKFVVMYIGNLGYKQDMAVLVKAAALLQDQRDIEFVIVGDGSERGKVADLIAQLSLQNTRLLDVQPSAVLSEMAAAADLFVVHQTRDVIDMVVPSKLLTYASAGRPILLAGLPASEGARFVSDSGSGRVVEPENPGVLADSILALRADPEIREGMAVKARSYVAKRFGRAPILAELEQIIQRAAS